MHFACALARRWRTIRDNHHEPAALHLRPRLFHKLFAAIVIACFVSIVLFGAVAHWSTQRSFLRYLNEERTERMSALATRLQAQYEAEQGFDHLRGDRQAWWRLLRSLGETSSEAVNETSSEGATPSPPWHDTGLRLARHMTLYDPDREIIAGRLPFSRATTTLALTVNGQTVGWLGAPQLKTRGDTRERRFARRQLQLFLIAAAIAGLLAIPVAWWLARRLVRPIRRLGHAARALAEGDFDARVPTGSGDELGQLAQDFNLLARALAENESARRRWIADVSHELRTPLAILAGEIEAARDGVRPLDGRFVDSLSAESDRLGQLVEDLYLLARADIGALDLEFTPLALERLVAEALARFANRMEAAGLSCQARLAPGCVVLADHRRLAQLLENLLENACRYIAAPGTLWVTLRRAGPHANLVVEDSGPGVPTDEHPHLFDPLHRGEASRSRRHGGSGLGLAICARIAHGHGGHIRARSSQHGGLAIELDIPLTEDA